MSKPLRALIVEDDENDLLLLTRELKRGGFDLSFERVDTPDAMSAALEKQRWDVVISDFVMPHFGGPAALALLKEHGLDLPFIIVSGTVDEHMAVDAMRAGAHDFMAKGKYARLIPAIERELRDAALRSERLRMQEQLLISERMASLGTLAAGVAHEINNPLAALMANLNFVAEDVEKLVTEVRSATPDSLASRLDSIDEPLREARESAERIRLIVRDLKALSRSDEEKKEAVDIRRVLDSAARMAWNEIRHRARIVKDFADVPPVEGNEARFGQVFLNLLVNAAQAIPEGRVDQNEIRVTVRKDPSGDVIVEVRDTGAGIPETVISRIFDPFFTTKPVGTGTGLGLAICHRIVTSLGGQIQVESQPGKGTVVRTILKAARVKAPEAATPTAAAAPAQRGRVLVVDDEPTLGNAIRRMLAPVHDVVIIRSARDAMELIAKGERVDVILCDLMMPDMTGMELHAEFERSAPALAAAMIFMTGGAFTPAAREFLDRVPNARLEKPFDTAVVREAVRSLMQDRS